MELPTVLFVCAANAGPSILAEAYLNAVAGRRARAFSAGVSPAERVHPHALRALAARNVPIDGLAPKAIELFALPHAPRPDVVVALSTDVPRRAELAWDPMPRRLWWPIPEPHGQTGTAGFAALLSDLTRRIEQGLADGVFARPVGAPAL